MQRRTSVALIVINAIVAVVLLCLVTAAVIGYSLYSKGEHAQLLSLNQVLTEQVKTGLALPLWNLDHSQIVAAAESVMNERSVYAVVVRKADSRGIILALVRGPHGKVIQTTKDIDSSGLLIHESKIEYSREVLGKVQLFVDPRFLEERLAKTRTVLFSVIAVVACILSLALYLILWLIVLRPLRQLEQYAHGVNKGEAGDSRLETNIFFGELDSLRSSVLVMVAMLEARYAELLLETKRFRDSEERFRTLVRTIPDLVWLKDADGIYLSCNTAFERFFGAKEADIVGRSDYDFVDPDLADSFRRHDHIAMAAGKPSSNEEWVTFADDGRHALLETTKTPLYDSEGSLIGVLGLSHDITERKRAEEELERHREHLEVLVEERTSQLLLARDAANAASQAKSMFLANMSHEIRTPLNAVLGFAQLLGRDPSLSPAARIRVATIMKSGEHLLCLINDILDMSRIEAGRVELRKESLDLPVLLEDLAAMFRLRAEEKGLSFSLDLSAELPRYILTDPGKLRQILINLLGNAVKFTMQGSITLHAEPSEGGRLAIEVRDTGIGVTPKELELLFRPFERVRSGEQSASGTGLGLAISREYAHLLGGEITVASRSGEGSSFRLEFPVTESASAPAHRETALRITGLAPGQGELRVLVVDDLSTNRDILRGMLEPLGFVVDEARNGEESIDKARALMPHIILMDLVMPGMDGGEATRVLRESFTGKSPTVIGISASALDEEKKRFLASGVDAFLAKPFREQELFEVLARRAGVRFETEAEPTPLGQKETEMPNLEKMPAEWREEFRQALTRNNITRIKALAEVAQGVDPALASWLLERAARYDLDGLKSAIAEATR